MSERPSRRTALAAVLAMSLAACTSGGSDADSGTTVGGAAPVDEPSQTTVAAEGEQTLAAFMGWDVDPEDAEAQYREQEARIQESIRQCMVAEGFEYVPVEPPADAFGVVDERTPEEWAAEQGFGITTWVGNEEAFSGPETEWVDPNQEIVDAMSESEREAYYAALYGSEEEQQAGTTSEIDPETGEEVFYSEGFGFGCSGEAYEAEYGNQDDLYTELGPELEAMNERIMADPRIVALDTEWSACMADKGYTYESQEKMYEEVSTDLQARLDAIVGPNGGYVDPFEGWTEEEINAFFEEKTEEEVNAFFEQAQNQAPEYDVAALEALQQEEIEIAVAAAECQGDFEEVYAEVSAEYESEFIAANQTKLEEIRASADGQG
jgi:hypothetical protein